MKKNLDAVLNDLNGNPLKNGTGTDAPELTFKDSALIALMGVYQDEQNLSGAVKAKRYALAQKVNAGGTADFSIEELGMLKDLIGKCFGPAVVGPAYAIIDGDNDAS